MSTSPIQSTVVVVEPQVTVVEVVDTTVMVIDGTDPATVIEVQGPTVTQTVTVVDEVVTVVYVAEQGPEGAGYRQYEHQQPAASAVWTVAHNLGFRPAVQVLSVGGLEMMAEVVHLSANVFQVLFDSPEAGSATYA